jgi:hypothetical protein
MTFIATVFLYISWVNAGLMIIGLFKPWVVLWWEDIQNRRKVIRLYGTLAIVSFILHQLFKMF